MANIRDLKKDINYVLGEIIEMAMDWEKPIQMEINQKLLPLLMKPLRLLTLLVLVYMKKELTISVRTTVLSLLTWKLKTMSLLPNSMRFKYLSKG